MTTVQIVEAEKVVCYFGDLSLGEWCKHKQLGYCIRVCGKQLKQEFLTNTVVQVATGALVCIKGDEKVKLIKHVVIREIVLGDSDNDNSNSGTE